MPGAKPSVDPQGSGNVQDIQDKIACARAVMVEKGGELARDKRVQELLLMYDNAISRTSASMKKLDLPGLCSSCATSIEGGGCCGSGIDEWYDHYLIIMNLMLGLELPERRYDPGSCFFLGPEGCTIRARYHFCVNYLCYRIHERYGVDELNELTSVSGKELYISWLLEIRLRELGI